MAYALVRANQLPTLKHKRPAAKNCAGLALRLSTERGRSGAWRMKTRRRLTTA